MCLIEGAKVDWLSRFFVTYHFCMGSAGPTGIVHETFPVNVCSAGFLFEAMLLFISARFLCTWLL
jgi:hypothetical protein